MDLIWTFIIYDKIIHKQASEFKEMSQKSQRYLFTAEATLTLLNSNQQYSQKII